MKSTEHFEVERFTRWMLLACPWIFLALATFGLVLPLLPGDAEPRNETFERGRSIVVVLVFGVLAWLSWRVVRELPFAAVSLDGQGIWKSAGDRTASLVRWSDVVSFRERPFLQRLELLGRTGELLLKLEYQLQDFSRLRSIVLERSSLEHFSTLHGRIFARSVAYHLFNAVSLVGYSALGLYIWPTNVLLGAALLLVVFGLCFREYLTTAHKLELRPAHLLVSWPLKKLTLSRADIVEVEVSDRFVHHARHPQVVLAHRKSSKPVVLRGLGSSAVELKLVLESWQRNAA